MLIFNVFFVGYDKPALAEHTRDLFKPIPLSVIAFAATAVRSHLGFLDTVLTTYFVD